MAKEVVLAVAGAGKTSRLISQLDSERRFLVLTFTENNFENLKEKVINKFGFVPANISVFTYFSFLHSFCFVPFHQMRQGSRGIDFSMPPSWTMKLRRDDPKHYFSKSSRIYYSRLAKFLINTGSLRRVIPRLEKYFDVLMIDEIQDFGGYDFDFLVGVASAKVDVTMVGDFYQHTYVTSSDGVKNKNLHSDIARYVNTFEKAGYKVDQTTLSKSHRCPEPVCQFIREQLQIAIYPARDGIDAPAVTILNDQNAIDEIFVSDKIVKLFLKEHIKYGCYSQNWGGSKGQDHYGDVCVVLNETSFKAFQTQDMQSLNPQTRNKLYVACSRTRGALYIVSEKQVRKYKT